MQSLRSRIFIWMIRNRQLFKMKLKPEVVDSSFSVDKFRADVARATARMNLPEGINVEKEQIDGNEC